jgi:polyisoprenoid-binding protein YceI
LQFRYRSLLSLAILTVAAAAHAQTWQIDPNHSAAQFAVRHLAVSTVRGQFNKMSGTVVYNPADPTKTQIDAVIDATTIDTRIERRDNDLRSANYFDVAKYPTITFKSKRVEAAGASKMKVIGDLTIHGVTKEVALDVSDIVGPSKDARGTERIGATAATKLNRHDFGVSGGSAIVADEVNITIDMELVKQQ